MKVNKFVGQRKGINTILASLLMVVIVVVAAVMVYAWSTGLLGTLLVNPNNNKEGPLVADTINFPSAQNITLYIRNQGTLGVTLTSFYITDSSGDTWQDLSWTGPTIAAGQVSTVNLSIPNTSTSTACWSNTQAAATCGYIAGTGTFTSFTSGAYTIKVVTGRNNPFSLPATK